MKIFRIISYGSIIAASAMLFAARSHAQISFGAGAYSQNFDTLANTVGQNTNWVDNSTLPGWYAAKAGGSGGSGAIASYRIDTGASTTGALYSYGSTTATDRSLGSLGSGSVGTQAYGLRFTNNTGLVVSNITVSYTGEQWRCGGKVTVDALQFSYRIASTNIIDVEPTNTTSWTAATQLNFNSPTAVATSGALDGNNATNRTAVTGSLTNVVVLAGEEIMLRWRDVDDSGSDHGLSLDDVSVTFTTVAGDTNAPTITQQPASLTVTQGQTATFTVQSSGQTPFGYQWYLGASPIDSSVTPTATNQTLTLAYANTNQAGSYHVVVSNVKGDATSSNATLIVNLPTIVVTNIAYLRTLQGPTNYVPTDTNTLFSVKGTVTTYFNMTTVGNTEFFMQDSTGGLAVFIGGASISVSPGDYVQVVGPLGHFNGFLEMNLVGANPSHSYTFISNNPAMPAPVVFDFANSNNIPLMETNIEGMRVVVSNVFIAGAGGFFISGSNTNMTNQKGQNFPLRVDSRVIDVIGQGVPEFASSIIGVMGQFGSGPSYTNGYQLFITHFADLTTNFPAVLLKVANSNNNAVVSWVTNATGFVLQTNASVTAAGWGDATNTPATNANFNVVTVPASGAQFYRLKKTYP
jgi:hypothetical protein